MSNDSSREPRNFRPLSATRMRLGAVLLAVTVLACDAGAALLNASTDFDGDGRADRAAYRHDGTWWVYPGNTLSNPQFGWIQSDPVPGDYDGDGTADLAVYHQASGTWYIMQSQDGFLVQQFGWSAARPVAADYDGDGRTDIAVYHQASGTWYILRSRDGFHMMQFGWSAAEPVPADYDGDGRTDLAVYHPATGTWYLMRSTAGFTTRQFGWSQADPVPGDYDGDGQADVSVYHADGDLWYMMQSQAGFHTLSFGALPSEYPIPARYNSTGETAAAVFDFSSQRCHIEGHAALPCGDEANQTFPVQNTVPYIPRGYGLFTYSYGDTPFHFTSSGLYDHRRRLPEYFPPWDQQIWLPEGWYTFDTHFYAEFGMYYATDELDTVFYLPANRVVAYELRGGGIVFEPPTPIYYNPPVFERKY